MANPNWKKGESANPNGRPRGSKNRVTQEIRKAYQRLAESNLENMSAWVAQVAAEDPAKAMDIMIKLSEYIIPKLARTEVAGHDGEDLFKNIKFQFGPDINDDTERQQDDFDLDEFN